MSQYYPELTGFTPYFIYTGFSHVARAQGLDKTAHETVQATMNELYSEILTHAMKQNKDITFIDTTSSLNPVGGNHTSQIEPNKEGAAILGQLIAAAITTN